MQKNVDRSSYLFDNRALVALIIPLIIEQFLAVLVGLADTIMIASVGEAAVSGVSLVDNIMVLFINIFAALATGGAVIAGQYLGQKNDERACKATEQIVWFTTVIAIMIMALLYLGKRFILDVVFGTIEVDVMGHANVYMLIVLASVPFIALYNASAAIFRSMGNSRLPMQVALIMNVINISGNAILIYGVRMGTAGVAIPTLVSRMVAAVIITVRLCDQKQQLHLGRTFFFRPDWQMIKRILRIGIPNSLENGTFQLGKILVLSLVATFGTYSIAANAVSNAVALFQILPGMAIGLALTTVVARCVGAGDYVQTDYYIKKLLRIAYVNLVIINALIYLALPYILEAYHLSDKTAGIAQDILHFHGACCVLIWPLSFCVPTALRAAGDVNVTMVVAIVSMWLFRVAFSYVLGIYLNMGVFGIWVAMVIDWCVRSICLGIRYQTGKWKLIRSI